MIIRASESKPKEAHYALCSVAKVKGAAGPPTGCTTVAIVTPNRTWLRGGSRSQWWCYAAATFRNTGAINIRYEVLTNLPPRLFSDSLLKVLQSDLGLTTEESSQDKDRKYVSIKSVSELRLSRVLEGGWREALDFDLFLSEDEKGKLSFVGTAHVAVCRQAVGNLTEYLGLSDAQRSMYASRLDSLMSKALRTACSSSEQRDSKTIKCN